MCGCEGSYVCPKCKNVTEHDDVYAEIHAPEPRPDWFAEPPRESEHGA